MDLDNIFKKSISKNKGKSKEGDLIVTTDKVLEERVKQVYAIEGYNEPTIVTNIETESDSSNGEIKFKRIVFDMRNSRNIIEELSNLTSKLDVDISILVLSEIDSIKLRNEVHSIGCTYVLWDPECNELIDALSNNDISYAVGKKKSRVAKKILVLGTKGGIGVSFFSAVLSNSLAADSKLKTLLVDHDTGSYNSDIVLGLKKHAFKQNTLTLNESDIDEAIAKTYISNVASKLDYLVLEKEDDYFGPHSQTLSRLSSVLEASYNFIIDSVSIRAFDDFNAKELIGRYQKIIVVCDPSLASLRSFNLIREKLTGIDLKAVFVMNRPAKDYIVPITQAKQRLPCDESYTINYEPSLEKLVVQQGLSEVKKSKYFSAIAEIVESMTGKDVKPKSKFQIFKL